MQAKEIKHLLLLNPAVWDVGTTTPAQPAGARRAIFTVTGSSGGPGAQGWLAARAAAPPMAVPLVRGQPHVPYLPSVSAHVLSLVLQSSRGVTEMDGLLTFTHKPQALSWEQSERGPCIRYKTGKWKQPCRSGQG